MPKGKRLDIDDIRCVVEEFGHELLTEKYIVSEVLTIKCTKHGNFTTMYNNFNNSVRKGFNGCPFCSGGKTHYKEVKELIKELGHELISSEIENSKSILDIKCPEHGIFKSNIDNIRSSIKKGRNGCNKCSGRARYEHEEIKGIIAKEGYKLITKEYKNDRQDLEVECPIHGIFIRKFVSFQLGIKKGHYGCQKCTHQKKVNQTLLEYDFIKTKIEEQGHKLLSDKYINSRSDLLIECEIHGKFTTCWTEFNSKIKNNNNGCPRCGIESVNKDRKLSYEFVKECIETQGHTIVSENYKNCLSKLIFYCLRHGEMHTTWNQFNNSIKGGFNGCRKCSSELHHELQRKTTDEFITEVYDLVGDEYTVHSDYNGAFEKVEMRHSTCGCKYEVTADNFLRGRRCPQCFESKGEQKIRLFLKQKGISFLSQYEFKNLQSDKGNPLRFDFALFYDIKKANLALLVEYDGEFHFNKYYEDQNFETLQYHDSLKNEYCKNHNIPLVRIPYWEFDNIETILINELFTFGLIQSQQNIV